MITLVILVMTLGVNIVAAQNDLYIEDPNAGQLFWWYLLLCIGFVAMIVLQKVDGAFGTSGAFVECVAAIVAASAVVGAFGAFDAFAAIVAVDPFVFPAIVAVVLLLIFAFVVFDIENKSKKIVGYIYYFAIIIIMIMLYYR